MIPIHVLHVPGADPMRDRIVRDLVSQGDACVHADPQRAGCMATWLKALGCAAANDADYPWSVILSDDADPLPNWQHELEAACESSPASVLGLTHFGAYGLSAVRARVPYVVGPHLVWGGAIAYHRSVVRPLYTWAMEVVAATNYPHDDILVMEFQRLTNAGTAMTARAIFDQPVAKSLIGHGGRFRSPSSLISDSPRIEWDAEPRFTRNATRQAPGRLPDLTGISPPRSMG